MNWKTGGSPGRPWIEWFTEIPGGTAYGLEWHMVEYEPLVWSNVNDNPEKDFETARIPKNWILA